MGINDDFTAGFRALYGWFDTRKFRVSSMDDKMVTKLANRIGYPNDRSTIGRWLTSMDCNVFTSGDGQGLELVVVSPADGSKPGIYRLRTIRTAQRSLSEAGQDII